MPRSASRSLLAADIGNSHIKLGRFLPNDAAPRCPDEKRSSSSARVLPVPEETLVLPLKGEAAEFDEVALESWLQQQRMSAADWLVASVQRTAQQRLHWFVKQKSAARDTYTYRALTYQEISTPIDLPAPQQVGIDRLLAAEGANQLRASDRGVVVVDHGSAVTIDLVDRRGHFVGGAIMPGVAMAAAVLAAKTDVLPLVPLPLPSEPDACGRSTVDAITAGLYWGHRGAIGKIVQQLALAEPSPPAVILTGGGAAELAEPLARDTGLPVGHLPHLVLSAIRLVSLSNEGKITSSFRPSPPRGELR